ncbi:MAG: peptidase S1 [Leptolyngbya sp.]|nr:MAG: peptidase S1 [Leptolyngbya sp.]
MIETVLALALVLGQEFSLLPFATSPLVNLAVNLALLRPGLDVGQFLPRSIAPSPLVPNRDAKALEAISRAITVKVKAGRNGGSGVLIRRQGQLYTVLTNRHVVTPGAPYVIQTLDQRSHPASLLKKIDFRGNDLALLQFRSVNQYAIAILGRSGALAQNDSVIAAGYPLDESSSQNRFFQSTGKVSLIPKQPLVGGYQLGYTNLVFQGMSGGSVLNVKGEVVGINSLHAYPLWGDPYVFVDGSKPANPERSLIVRSSWAVPIDTFLCLAPEIVKTNVLMCRVDRKR